MRGTTGGKVRERTEKAILAVLADFIADWEGQHAALGRIMRIVSPGDDPGLRGEMERAVADIMQWDTVLNRGRIQGLASILLTQQYSPAQLRAVYRLHPDSPWGKDWRSENGTKPPSERGLRDTVAQLIRVADHGEVINLDG